MNDPDPEVPERDADEPSPDGPTDFERTSQERQPSLVAEFIAFLREEKKWWLVPIVLVLLMLTLLAWVGGSSLAPFVYPGL